MCKLEIKDNPQIVIVTSKYVVYCMKLMLNITEQISLHG